MDISWRVASLAGRLLDSPWTLRGLPLDKNWRPAQRPDMDRDGVPQVGCSKPACQAPLFQSGWSRRHTCTS